jgi:deazaflavin-dependent oxidoreductase (nitroreductase family)
LINLANPPVRILARSPAHRLLDRTTLVLHVTGRRTGRRYDLPVSFVKVGEEFFVVTQHRWRVNLRGGADLEITHAGRRRAAHAEVDEAPAAVARGLSAVIAEIGWPGARHLLGLRTSHGAAPSKAELEAWAARDSLAVVRITPSAVQPVLPPRWVIRAFWQAHRAVVRVTGARVGLWRPRPGHWGTLLLTTTGRRTGRPRRVLLGYLDDGPDLVTLAMNGWGAAEPAWWLNLRAAPDAVVRTRDGTLVVHARAAQGVERERLWAQWAGVDANLDDYAALRPGETAVVVLEPT